MRNLTKKLLSIVLLSSTIASAGACNIMGGGSSSSGADNSNKATLYVYSFTSGFGKEWLESLIADYEEEKKDVVIGDKKGIHIEPTAVKEDVPGATMAGRDEVVYFLEQQDYYELLAGNYIADITSAITSINPYDGKTLESKMFEDQKSYFARTVNGETRYYAYPHYYTNFGIVYDIGLFDDMGYYLKDGYNPNGALVDMFLGKDGGTKSAGPDGQKGNSDDGLPATYDEFFLLCDYISGIGGDNPLIWSGAHRDAYLTHFLNALATDYNGYEQMRLNFTFDGDATNLGTVVNGKFVKDAEPTTIDGTNGAELARQAGKFYAMDFYNTLYNKSYINNQKNKLTLYSSSYTHLQAQSAFLKGSDDGTDNAMLLDGSWWQMEATSTFDTMGKLSADYSKQNRKLGWMPLPKQSKELVGKQFTSYDIMYPLCLMKNGLDPNSWQYKYALDFIQFANSDEQLAKFTQITGCTKALDYSLTRDQYNALSYYGKTFYDSYKSSKIVFPYANNLLYANNQKTFKEIDNTGAGSPLYKSTAYATYFTKGLENGVSVEKYFNGMYDYFKELTIWKKSK